MGNAASEARDGPAAASKAAATAPKKSDRDAGGLAAGADGKAAESHDHHDDGGAREELDPALIKPLQRMWSQRSSASSFRTQGSQQTQGSQHTLESERTAGTQASTMHDSFVPEVRNAACGYGYLRFLSGAVLQGTICNRMESMSLDFDDGTLDDHHPATFLTPHQELVHGHWVFQRLQFSLEEQSPVAVYQIEANILLRDSSVHDYKGPAHLILKHGHLRLPLARTLLQDGPAQRTLPKPAANALSTPEKASSGKRLLLIGLGAKGGKPPQRVVQYSKYPLWSPHEGKMTAFKDDEEEECSDEAPEGKTLMDRARPSPVSTMGVRGGDTSPARSPVLARRKTTNVTSQQAQRIRRDHRVMFWSLCGKEMAKSRWDPAIQSDLVRTHFHRFADRTEDMAREQLHSILRYIAIAFPSVGYCQGMHCVAKFLLMFSEPPVVSTHGLARRARSSGAEEDQGVEHQDARSIPKRRGSSQVSSSVIKLETETAFVLFAQLMEDPKYRMQDLFDPSFKFYRDVLDDIDRRVAASEPVVFEHLGGFGLSAVVYAAKWMLTLFTFYVDQDFRSVTNVWLRFLSQGWDALVDIAVACVTSVKEHLLNADAEECMLILSGTTDATPHGILETVFGTLRGQALLRPHDVQDLAISKTSSAKELTSCAVAAAAEGEQDSIGRTRSNSSHESPRTPPDDGPPPGLRNFDAEVLRAVPQRRFSHT